MEMIPSDEWKHTQGFNFAPMIDFLFLMLSLFAVLAVSRAALLDTRVDLVELTPEPNATTLRSQAEKQPIHISVLSDGSYQWLTEFQEYPMPSPEAVQKELARQYQLGALPQDKNATEILLHIDRRAPWEPIAQLIFAVRELGFEARPVYEGSTAHESKKL